MTNVPKTRLEEILALPIQTLASVVLWHLVILGIALFGGLPYLIMQAAFAAEILLLDFATIPFYPEREKGKHAFDMLKMTGALVFIYFFVFVTYAVAINDGHNEVLAIAWRTLDAADGRDLMVALFYIAISLGFSLWQTFRLPDRKQAWTKRRLLDGGATLIAMTVMCFVAVIMGAPMISLSKEIGHPLNPDSVLITLMVVTRCVFSLVTACLPESTIRSISNKPFVD